MSKSVPSGSQHRISKVVRSFLTPRFDNRFAVRLGLVVVATVLVCTFWLRPAMLDGISMQPTYSGRCPQETHVSGIIDARRLFGKPLW